MTFEIYDKMYKDWLRNIPERYLTNNIDVNSLYPGLLSEKTIIPKEYYDRHILGIFDDKEVNKVSEPYMNRYTREDTDRDIHFLFETDTWNGNKIKDMTSSHIINSALMLLKRATEFKLNYELFVIDNTGNKLLVPKDNIEDLAKLDDTTWVKTTPIFVAFTKELAERKLLSYFDIVLNRMETNKGTED